MHDVSSESVGSKQGSRVSPNSRRYRSKIEVLRDFLSAVREAPKKTRIMGIANLKTTAFERYLALSAGLDLVQSVSGGYCLTPKAEATLAAIEGFLSRGAELDTALRDLQRSIGQRGAVKPDGGPGLRFVSNIARSEVVLRSGACPNDGEDESFPQDSSRHVTRREISVPTVARTRPVASLVLARPD